MKNNLIILMSLFAFGFGFSQQQEHSFSLDEAIAFALENNRTAVNAERDIEAAKKQKWETTTIGLPQISANIDYQNFLKLPVSLLPAAAFDNRESTIQTVEDFFGLTRTSSPDPVDGFIPVQFGTKQTVNASAQLNQLIFDGSYLVGLQSAKVFLEISRNAKEKTDLEVRKNVISSYGNVLLAEESVKILEKNRETLQKNLNDTQKIFENGLNEEEDVEQLQITLAGIESNLSNTKRLRDIAYKILNIALGTDIQDKVTLTDDLVSLTTKNIDLGLMTSEFNVANNIDFRIAENNTKSEELLLKLEKSKALPTLSAFLNAGYQGNNDEFNFFSSDQQWFGSAVVGVNMSIPIFSSFGRTARTQRAKINLEKARTEQTEIEQRLKLDIDNARSQYAFSIEQYETSKKNLSLAERIENKNQTKFFEGIGSSFELRQAQTQLYGIQQEYLQAMLDVINKKAELETLLNTKN